MTHPWKWGVLYFIWVQYIASLLTGSLRRLVNTLRPRQDGRHFPDDIFKYIFLNENAQIFIKISPMFVPKDSIDNIPTLVQIMAWRRPGDQPLSEPMMHICITRPQWVKSSPWQRRQLVSFQFEIILLCPSKQITMGSGWYNITSTLWLFTG